MMRLVQYLKLLHVVDITRPSFNMINPFLVQGNRISISCAKTYADIFCNICSVTSKKIKQKNPPKNQKNPLLYKCFYSFFQFKAKGVVSMYGEFYKESERLKLKKETLFSTLCTLFHWSYQC